MPKDYFSSWFNSDITTDSDAEIRLKTASMPAAYSLATWQANGGTVRVRSNSACTIYGITYNIVRTHKAR